MSDRLAEIKLTPAERIALMVGLAQVRRGDEPMPNVATICILALSRLTDGYDYTKGDSDGKDFANL